MLHRKVLKDAIFKYNNGKAALLCSKCSVIIKIGREFTDYETRAILGEVELASQYCNKCKENGKFNNII